MSTEAAEAALIEGTIRDLREAVVLLERQRAQLDAQIKEKRDRLTAWEARLSKIATAVAGGGQRTRQTRAENLRRLIAVLSEEASGVPLPELARRAGVPSSSVRVLVKKRNADQFDETSGLIRLRHKPTEP